MADLSFVFEIIRLVLYGAEFISDIVVFSATADKLFDRGLGVTLCALSKNGTGPQCQIIIAFAVIAWLVLLAVIITHCLKYLDKAFLPYLAEAGIFAGLAVLWFVIAMLTIRSAGGRTVVTTFVTITTKSLKDVSEVVAVRFFSWFNILLHLLSAAVAFLSSRADVGKDEEAAPAQGVPGTPTASV